MTAVTSSQAANAVQFIATLAEAIRTAGEVPSGTIYAATCGSTDIVQYQYALGILKRAGLVEESRSHMLKWVGPRIEGEKR